MSILSTHHLYWVIPVLLLAIGAVYWSRMQRQRVIDLLTQGAETCNLRSNASPYRRKILAIALLAALILALIAVLRPSGGVILSEHRRPAKNLIVLLDASKSMAANDVEGLTRMEAAKLLLREWVNTRPTDRIGLISFAGAAFPECPTTLDRSMLRQRIDNLRPGDIPAAGTNINVALLEAQKLLTEEPPPGSAIIILSDGDNVTGSAPKLVLENFKKAEVPIFAIAFGDPSMPAELPNTTLTTQSNHGNLKALSDATRGMYLAGVPAKVDAQINELNTRIDTIEFFGGNIAAEIYDRPLDLYAYPLTAALLLLMLHLFLPLRSKSWHPLTAGIALSFFLIGKSPAEHYTSYEAGLLEAKKEELPLSVIFTGSDWSKLSIVFEREILSHQVYQDWAKSKVVTVLIDLPRTGLDDTLRTKRRKLVKKFDVTGYPMVIFLDTEEQKLGSLTHDPKGAASWVKRANAILGGDRSQSDTAASVEYLPKETRDRLDDENLTDAQRSVAHFNKALEMERAEPDLELNSKDRFKLLLDLYAKAAEFAPNDRPDLLFMARLKLGLLHHRKGKSMVPNSQEELMMAAMQAQKKPLDLLKSAKKSYRRGLTLYRQAAPLNPGHEGLSTNLAVLYRDLDRVEAYINFFEAYTRALDSTWTALDQEKLFLKSLEREVTTQREVNKAAIDESSQAIDDLIKKAIVIKEKPTLLPEDGLKDYKLALEDIVLAPSPHRDRNLAAATQHIQDALDHLIDPKQQQPQPQDRQQKGEGEPSEESGDGEGEEDGGEDDNPEGDQPDEGEDEGEKEEQGNSDSDLRRSEKENGDLRDRLLEKMRWEYRKLKPRKDH